MILVSPEVRNRVLHLLYEIERDGTIDHTVVSLADRCDLSPRYFQRVFQQLTGERVKPYMQRLRLQAAALMLKTTDDPVIEISDRCGFATHSGFTKAFRRAYGCSPSQLREHETSWSPPSEWPFCEASLAAGPLAVRIEWLETRHFVARRHLGPLAGVFSLWARMVGWARERGEGDEPRDGFGFHYDDWGPAGGRVRYDAAFEIDGRGREAQLERDGLVTLEVPGGWTAVVDYAGGLLGLDRAWWRLIHDWLPASGYRGRTNFAYERYAGSQLSTSALRNAAAALDLRVQLHLPLQLSTSPRC